MEAAAAAGPVAAVVAGLPASIGTAVAQVHYAAPVPLRSLVTMAIEVFLMTDVLLPRIPRALFRWIQPTKEVT